MLHKHPYPQSRMSQLTQISQNSHHLSSSHRLIDHTGFHSHVNQNPGHPSTGITPLNVSSKYQTPTNTHSFNYPTSQRSVNSPRPSAYGDFLNQSNHSGFYTGRATRKFEEGSSNYDSLYQVQYASAKSDKSENYTNAANLEAWEV